MAAKKGELHHNAKLTEADVAEIRATYKPRVVTAKMLAEKFGVSQQAIRSVIDGRSWTKVEGEVSE